MLNSMPFQRKRHGAVSVPLPLFGNSDAIWVLSEVAGTGVAVLTIELSQLNMSRRRALESDISGGFSLAQT
jgi:hypothetical protein